MEELYNRDVPQADGSYRKTRVSSPEDPKKSYQQEEIPPVSWENHEKSGNHRCRSAPLGSFFRNLLPHDLDTEDLIVILLLLLLSQDGGKNGNRAMLTLGAYLFL